jgi:hypothetical protein
MHRVVARVTFVLILTHGFANYPYVICVDGGLQLTLVPVWLHVDWDSGNFRPESSQRLLSRFFS